MHKRIGIIVDGQGDFACFHRKLGGMCKVLKTDGPRGHTVSIDDLARGSRKELLMLKAFGCHLAVIVTDFEARKGNYLAFLAELQQEFLRWCSPIPVKIAAPNRMIENWFLADIEILSKTKVYIRDNLKQKSFEGHDGKKELRRLFARGYRYSEVENGPEMFCAIRPEIAAANSASFRILKEYLAL